MSPWATAALATEPGDVVCGGCWLADGDVTDSRVGSVSAAVAAGGEVTGPERQPVLPRRVGNSDSDANDR